ncbi:MAG: sulfatase-like hydrolase/transferase [Planctomycetaceae bacterium]
MTFRSRAVGDFCLHSLPGIATQALRACTVGFVVTLALSARSSESAGRPDIVLILADDLGYADLGCFGGKAIRTPHLDRIAAEGVRLTNFSVAWPACTPSRAALLTGRYPQRNGLYDMIRNDRVNDGHRYTEEEYAVSPEMTLGLDEREITITEVLHDAGYATGMVGKWDSGRAKRFLPPRRGFDVFYGFANTGIDYYTHERYGVPSMFRGLDRTEEDKGTYATDLFRREAVNFVRKNADRPFFLYLAFNAPHSASNLEKDSQQVPQEYLDRYYSDADPKNRRTKYMGMVSAMDEAIGELLDVLDEKGLTENTLFVFHSDNGGSGPGDNGPLHGGKATMWEGGLRVPAIVRWPKQLPAGTTSDEFLTSLEVFPTLLAAANVAKPDGVKLDGFDMRPVLKGEASSKRETMFWKRRSDKAARIGRYKWIESTKGGGLFDLETDLGEQRDLSAEKPDVLADLKNRFATWQAEMDASEPRGPFRDY